MDNEQKMRLLLSVAWMLGLGLYAASVARRKGYSPLLFFFLGPLLLGVLFLRVLPDKR